MADWRDELLTRAKAYAERYGLDIETPELGSGVHGIVLPAKCQSVAGKTAIKVHERERFYERERDVYLRLQERGVLKIRSCNVPQLVAFDDDLWVIEMSIVRRPFVLDFAGAYLDSPPDYPQETLEEWKKEKQEQFGAAWPEVRRVLAELESHGIYMADVSPGNVALQA